MQGGRSSTSAASDQIFVEEGGGGGGGGEDGGIEVGSKTTSFSNPFVVTRDLVSFTTWDHRMEWTWLVRVLAMLQSSFQNIGGRGWKVVDGDGGERCGGSVRFVAFQVNRFSFFKRRLALANQVDT